MLKILVGLTYTYIGLVLFLTGVNVGFMPAGNYLGQIIVQENHPWIIIPIAMIIGFFIVKAEPAVSDLSADLSQLPDDTIIEL